MFSIISVAYLGAITAGMMVVYVVLYILFQKLYTNTYVALSRTSILSILTLSLLSIAVYVISAYFFSDPVLGNRFLHAFGGGFMLFLVINTVLEDAHIVLKRSALFVIGFMIVTLLGLFNEVCEAFLQQHIDFVFAPSLADTLLDLMSNTIGFLLAYFVSLRSKA